MEGGGGLVENIIKIKCIILFMMEKNILWTIHGNILSSKWRGAVENHLKNRFTHLKDGS